MTETISLEVLASADAVAKRAADFIAEEARKAVSERGRFVLAVSGGRTPWIMLRALASLEVPWSAVHIAQVDERVAPAGHPDRNLTHLRETLLDLVPVKAEHVHAMPVESDDLVAAAGAYAASLPSQIDLVHLGLGNDGHTASLVPGDPVLNVSDADFALTGVYQGRRRMTLTYPVINRARQILWVVTGEEKTPMLKRLLAGDTSIPAGRVRRAQALIIGDRAATGQNDERES